VHLTFLGTSAGTPTRERNVSALAIQLEGGEVWLVDCGEGTQQQILRSSVRPGRIRRILLTHLHGDHCFGVPGLLASIGLHGGKGPVQVLGPVGTARFVDAAIAASATTLPFELEVRELAGRCDLVSDDGTRLVAEPIVHRVTCFGYVIEAPAKRGRLDVDAARARGVSGADLGRLTRGEDITVLGGKVVRAGEVLGPTRRGAKVVVLGDTSDPSGIAAAAASCDLLVHEATYGAALHDKALAYGHSTAAMAGSFAAHIGAGKLVLTHFSARYMEDGATPVIADLVREAELACPGTPVLAARDLLEIDVPT
jgi:ribonuclease Z